MPPIIPVAVLYVIYCIIRMNFLQKICDSRGARVSLWLWILKVKGSARNLHNLVSEVALITVWGATFRNQWENYGLPLTSCVIFTKPEHPIWTQNNTGCLWQPIIFPLIWKNAARNSHQDHLSIQNIQVFSWALDVPIISLNNALF